jgi:hypothetical protein
MPRLRSDQAGVPGNGPAAVIRQQQRLTRHTTTIASQR